MKTLRLFPIIAILLLAITSCEKKTDTKLDPMAPVYITGVDSGWSTSDSKGQEPLSIKEVIKTASHFGCHGIMYPDNLCLYTIDGVCTRDTTNNRIIGYSSWVIADNGDLQTEFIESRDFIILDIHYDMEKVNNEYPSDTLGYIPNSIMESAETAIKEAYNNEDYEACYDLFETAFVFYPCTGAQYLELANQDLN